MKDLGGVQDLNYACIPAKTVLHTAEIFHAVSSDGASRWDLDRLEGGSGAPHEGLQDPRGRRPGSLFWNKNKVEFLHDEASLAGPRERRVQRRHRQAKAIVSDHPDRSRCRFRVDRVIDTWGPVDPIAGDRRRRRVHSDAPHGSRGDPDRECRADPPPGGQGHGPGGGAPVQEGRHGGTGPKSQRRRGAEVASVASDGGRGQLSGDRGGTHVRHRSPQPRCRRREDRRSGPRWIDDFQRASAEGVFARSAIWSAACPQGRDMGAPSEPLPVTRPSRSTSTCIPGATFTHPQVGERGA